MNIGFDAKRAVLNHTGLGNYSRSLIEALTEYAPDNKYILFSPGIKPNARLSTILDRNNVRFVILRGLGRLFAPLWRTWGINWNIRRNRIDVYHGLSAELPAGIRRTGVRTVVTIHDLIFLRYPAYYPPIDRLIYRLKSRYACRTADRIIAVSECTARDIAAFFRIPEDKITVIYQSCHRSFGRDVAEETKRSVAAKYRLPARFVLNVGTIEARKNLCAVVRALARLPEAVHLVAAGRPTAYLKEVKRCAASAGVAHRLHFITDVAYEDLPAIYRLASAFVYPSLFEGFGIPVIEALASGVPVIAATGSCLEEAGGPDSLYVDPADDAALAQQIAAVLGDAQKAARMIEAGKAYVRRFDPELVARQVMNVYESLPPRYPYGK
jgi:glycosyltransferase involved in cell wall biosynthesis